VIDFERDINLVKAGEVGKDDLVYKTLVGLDDELQPARGPALLLPRDVTKSARVGSSSGEGSELSEGEGESGEDSDDEDSESRSKFINSARPRQESPDSKKVRYSYD
jgi:RIO kinase 1